MKESLEQLALQTAHLPSLPELVQDLRRLIDSNADLNVIADLLATDAALTVQVIELANSAFYGNKNISRIFDAVHLIGLNRVELFVRTACVMQLLRGLDGEVIDMRAFWRESNMAAVTARALADRIHYPQLETLYTAGLLMYIGRLIMALLPAQYDPSHLQPHKLAAAQLALWHFPPVLIEAIHYMAQPSACADVYALPASIVHLTDVILHPGRHTLDEDALHMTNLDETEIRHLADQINQAGLQQVGRFRLS